jgi:nitroreductase
MLKTKFQSILPTSIRQFLSEVGFARRLVANYYYDFWRYLKFSATIAPHETKARMQGRIIATYHVIEKGLSLKEPRTGFGMGIVTALIELLEKYSEKYTWDETAQVALNTLLAYNNFNLSRGHINEDLNVRLTKLKSRCVGEQHQTTEGGTRFVEKEAIKAAVAVNFQEFVNSRHSVRNFASDDVPLDLIQDSASIALKTPSVCNRQTWKIHVFSDDALKQKVLSYQNGNRGFGHTASKVVLVTCDLSNFLDAGERNQAFIDGGMFSMSFIYALHSFGVGTCCLNWSVTSERDQALRREIPIPETEVIIMMIAVGSLPDQFYVANSARRKVQEIVNYH